MDRNDLTAADRAEERVGFERALEWMLAPLAAVEAELEDPASEPLEEIFVILRPSLLARYLAAPEGVVMDVGKSLAGCRTLRRLRESLITQFETNPPPRGKRGRSSRPALDAGAVEAEFGKSAAALAEAVWPFIDVVKAAIEPTRRGDHRATAELWRIADQAAYVERLPRILHKERKALIRWVEAKVRSVATKYKLTPQEVVAQMEATGALARVRQRVVALSPKTNKQSLENYLVAALRARASDVADQMQRASSSETKPPARSTRRKLRDRAVQEKTTVEALVETGRARQRGRDPENQALTIGQLAEELGRPESTVRKAVRAYEREYGNLPREKRNYRIDRALVPRLASFLPTLTISREQLAKEMGLTTRVLERRLRMLPAEARDQPLVRKALAPNAALVPNEVDGIKRLLAMTPHEIGRLLAGDVEILEHEADRRD